MGYFKKAGEHGGKPYFQQMDSQGEGYYLYYYKERSQYQVGPTIGASWCGLRCTDKSGHIVSHHWQYSDGSQWTDDPDMRLVAVTNVTPCCSKVTIKLSGDVAKCQRDVAGDYVPIDKFSQGRQIYKHKYRNLFLRIPPRSTYWIVWSTVGIDGTPYIGSQSAGSLCPADQRNNYSHSDGQKSWKYVFGSGRAVEAGPGNIQLTCTSHN